MRELFSGIVDVKKIVFLFFFFFGWIHLAFFFFPDAAWSFYCHMLFFFFLRRWLANFAKTIHYRRKTEPRGSKLNGA